MKKEKIYGLRHKMPFGKYKCNKIWRIINHDKEYFTDIVNAGTLKLKPDVIEYLNGDFKSPREFEMRDSINLKELIKNNKLYQKQKDEFDKKLAKINNIISNAEFKIKE